MKSILGARKKGPFCLKHSTELHLPKEKYTESKA